MIEKICKWCNKLIVVEKHPHYASHVSSCRSNPNFLKRIDKYKEDYSGKQIVERITITKKCPRCNNDFELTGTEKQLYGRDSKKYCSIKCARARPQTDETKQKIINTLTTNYGSKPIKVIECKNCKKEIEIFQRRKDKKFCSRSCASKYSGNLPHNLEKARIRGREIAEKQAENRRSKNEIAFGERCKDYFSNVTFNENFFNGWDADIILHDAKIAVMWNGKWHYEKITEKHSVKQVQNRDNIKIKEIEKLGYTPYIIKDMGRFSEKKVQLEWDIFLEFMKKNFFLDGSPSWLRHYTHNVEIA